MKVKFSYSAEYRSLARLGAPVLVTQLSVILVSFIDTAMVGAYGVDELASAAFVNSIFMVPVVMLIGFAQGATPLVGALFGKKDTQRIGRMLRSGLTVNFLLALCLTAVMAGVYFLLGAFGQPEELLPIMRPYYLSILGSVIPMALFNVAMQTSNGVTDTKTPMWIMVGANLVNVVGNWLLIFGNLGCPRLGLLGAGIATLTARTTAAVAILLFFSGAPHLKPYWKAARAARDLRSERREMVRTSVPVMVQSGLEVVLWTVGAMVCGWFGKVQLAAYQVVNTISQLGFMIFMSFGVATSIRVANFAGQRDREAMRRIAKAGLHLNLLLATLACVVFYAFGRPLIHLFNDDPSVIASALGLIPPLILYQFADAVQLTYANALRGTSRVDPLMVVAAVAYCAIGIPTLLAMGKWMGMGNTGVYYSFSVALVSAAVMLRHYFLRALRRMQV